MPRKLRREIVLLSIGRLGWRLFALLAASLIAITLTNVPMTAVAHHARDIGQRVWIYPGLDTEGWDLITNGWHYDTSAPLGDRWALDLNTAVDEAGNGVWMDTATSVGVGSVWAQSEPHLSSANCTGVRVWLYDNTRGGEEFGLELFSHIDDGIGGWGWTLPTNRYGEFLGWVSSNQAYPCNPDWWSGPHVHQAGGPYYRGHWADRDPYPSPAPPATYWMHELRF